MVLICDVRADGSIVGAVVASEKSFKSGSDGYFGTSKVKINGVKFQIQVSAVRIHSRDEAEAESPAAEASGA